MHEAPYNVLGEGQGRTPIVGCQRRWISSLELTVEGQNHRTGLFYASLYTQWLMQSSGTLLRENINVSQEQKRKLVTPSKELCKHSSRPTFASLAFDRHHNNCSGEVVGRSWWVLEAGQRALSFQHFWKGLCFFLSSMGRTPNNLNVCIALCIHILDITTSLLDLFTSLSVALCCYDW